MSLQVERYKFIESMRTEGVPEDVTRLVLRHATTIQRLSVAECNGDWPCDNGERKVLPCPVCESGYVSSSIKAGACPNCRAARHITAALKPYGVVPDFQGDPRGACVKLKVPSGRTDDGGRIGLCVPTPRF